MKDLEKYLETRQNIEFRRNLMLVWGAAAWAFLAISILSSRESDAQDPKINVNFTSGVEGSRLIPQDSIITITCGEEKSGRNFRATIDNQELGSQNSIEASRFNSGPHTARCMEITPNNHSKSLQQTIYID